MESNRTTWNNVSLTSTNSDRFVLLTHLNTIHAHFLSARAVQGQSISSIQTSCATTYQISILICGEPSLACSLIPIRLPTGTAFYVVCRQTGFNFFSLNSMNRQNDSRNLFCAWQIGKSGRTLFTRSLC